MTLYKKYILYLCLPLVLLHCDNYNVFEDYPKIYESENFTIGGMADDISNDELELLADDLESAHEKLSEFLGEEFSTHKRIEVILKGDWKPQNETAASVDNDGIMYLRRMPEEEGGYTAHTDHELVHAFRTHSFFNSNNVHWENMAFLEEGFAEYFSATFFSEKNSLSNYQLPLEVVAGYWLRADPEINLAALRNNHSQFNAECNHQAYTLRASWLAYIMDKYGKAKLFELVYPDEVPTDSYVENIFEKNYAELDMDWKVWLDNSLDEITALDSLFNVYEGRIGGYEMCEF